VHEGARLLLARLLRRPLRRRLVQGRERCLHDELGVLLRYLSGGAVPGRPRESQLPSDG
jgi:hypothetical protein